MDPSVLTQQIGQVSNLLGLLLALISLFTSEQAQRLAREKNRQGGGTYRAIFHTCWILAAVTTLAVFTMAPLVRKALGTLSLDRDMDPVLSIFVLVWLLLLALVAWQVSIVVQAHRASSG